MSEQRPAFAILTALAVCHLLNDTNQSLLIALYPTIKETLSLNFTQIGILTLAFQATASLLQPGIGFYTDKRPLYRSLPIGMGFTFCGLLLFSVADTYGLLLLAAMLIGTGSAVFHPEASRVARLASGGRFGLAQSIFQVGGNAGQALGPLFAAFIVLARGRSSVGWFSLVALAASFILVWVAGWYRRRGTRSQGKKTVGAASPVGRRKVTLALAILLCLMFSKNIYTVSLSSYYTFYLIGVFHVSVAQAQLCLFAFLGATALATFVGGPLGDRIGRKNVIWLSVVGAVPFCLALPYVGLTVTILLSVVIGFVMGLSFSSIVVYAQELLPGRVGAVAGLFFGLSFGVAGLGAALLGILADHSSIGFVYEVCSFLPLFGLVTWFLPDVRLASGPVMATGQRASPV